MQVILLSLRIAVKKGSTAIKKRNKLNGSPCRTPLSIAKGRVRNPLTNTSEVAPEYSAATVLTNLGANPFLVRTWKSHW